MRRLARHIGRWLLLPFILLSQSSQARVVINEVFYHAPDDIEDLEYIELHNTSEEAADISGWAFTKGIKVKFPSGSRIEPKGFFILCRNQERFQEFYDAPAGATFSQKLSNNGERLELSDASGKVADTMAYKDKAPWPIAADGLSGSLERICPESDGADPSNWTSSLLSEDRLKPAGSPGQVNAAYSAVLPPVISNVSFMPEFPSAGEPIAVEADVRDPNAVTNVVLLYRIFKPGGESAETAVPMKKISDQRYAASIPGQASNQVIRFRIEAVNDKEARRFFPAETDARPALSAYVPGPVEPAKIPFGWIITPPGMETQPTRRRGRFPRQSRFDPDEMAVKQAREYLERILDFSGAWFELTLKPAVDHTTFQKLRPIFANLENERNRLIENVIKSPDIRMSFRTLPAATEEMVARALDALAPHISTARRQTVANLLRTPLSVRGQTTPRDPAAIVQDRIDLEEMWHAVSVRTELEPGRYDDLLKAFGKLLQERGALAAQATTFIGQENGARSLREKLTALEAKAADSIAPLLSPEQEKEFQVARTEGNPFRPAANRVAADVSSNRVSPPKPNLPTFVYYDPASRKFELFDFVNITPRSGGHKVRFYKDKPLNGMTGINLIFENEVAVLVEPLAYEVYRKAGMAAEQSHHVRLWINDRPRGYQLLVEQPNRSFLRRNKIPDDGNMYKLLWYEQGVVGKHEKKTNTREGHEDIVGLIKALEGTQGAAQWEVIEKHFDVNQVATYFAINTVLSHWDGFFNNYFTYHDVHGSGKWTMYPWDQDQTWGVIGGQVQSFYNMPITFGMAGDTPPGERRNPNGGDRFAFGGRGPGWWRPGGYFSSPLLANPKFRQVFLARTKEILETVYREDIFVPVINVMEEKLRDEVAFQAQLMENNPKQAIKNFERNLQGLRQHIKKRREFLLSQDEIKNAGGSK